MFTLTPDDRGLVLYLIICVSLVALVIWLARLMKDIARNFRAGLRGEGRADRGSYFVDIEGRTAGPFTLAEVAELYRTRAVDESSLYARPGSEEWLPLRTILPLLTEAQS